MVRVPFPNNLFFGVVLAVVAADQCTKYLAILFLSNVATVPVIAPFFHLTLVYNTGVAFGLFEGRGIWVTAGTLVLLAFLFRGFLRDSREPSAPRWPLVCMGLILGGAVGNLIDRIRLGAVIDFLDFRVWPVFNLADSCITVGAAAMAFYLLRKRG